MVTSQKKLGELTGRVIMTENTVSKTDKQSKPWQFSKGQSGNPNGKPKGTQHKATQLAQQLFKGEAENIIRKIIELALDGDMAALKICIDRICPPLKAQSQSIHIDYVKNQDLTNTAKQILEQVTQGNIPPDIGMQLINSIITITKTKEIEDIHKRIEAIQISLIKGKKP